MDSREIHTIEDITLTVDFPVYRVTFWVSMESVTGNSGSFNAERWRLSGVRDVQEVLVWASADGRPHEVFAESSNGAAGSADGYQSSDSPGSTRLGAMR